MPEYIRLAYPKPPQKTDYEKMAQLCLDAMEQHPEDREYLLAYRAVYLGYCGKHKQAVELCQQYLPTLTIKDCIDDMKNVLVNNLKQSGDTQAAIRVLEEQAENEPEKRWLLYDKIREHYTELKDTDNIIKYCLLMMNEGQVDTEVIEQLANAYDAKKDYLNSAKYFEKAAQNTGDETSWLWNNAGRALALAGQQDEAMFYFKMVLKIKPDSEMAHYYLGLAYQNKEDVYLAMHHYTEALKLKPDFTEVFNNIAAINYHENSNIKEAIQNLEAALEKNPNPQMLTTLYINLARLYKMIADYDKHEYYKAKMMQSVGFNIEFDEGDEDDLVEE